MHKIYRNISSNETYSQSILKFRKYWKDYHEIILPEEIDIANIELNNLKYEQE